MGPGIDAPNGKPSYFRGEWIPAGDERYDAARQGIFNTRFDPRPPAVARCLGNADVAAALAYAREHGHEVSVRSTGWSLAGFSSTDGLVIDLSLMRGVRVDPAARTAWIQGGVMGGDLQIEVARHGLAASTGMLSGTGVGLILGGGIGHLSRRAGYASDNVLAVELVTAAGEVVTASPEENPDLFWAVRGTMGNFGVVTALKVKLHEVPPLVLAGALTWTGPRAQQALRALAEVVEWGSDDFNVLGMMAPETTTIWFCHSGPPEVAKEEVARLTSFADPDDGEVEEIPFRDLTFVHDEEYPPLRALMEEEVVKDLDDDLIALLEERVGMPLPEGSEGAWMAEISPRYRALSRAPEHPSAVHPGPAEPCWTIVPGAWWTDAAEDAAHIGWVEESCAAVRDRVGAFGLAQPNGIGRQVDAARLAEVYGEGFQRLRELKRRWDPDNVFRANLNIEPAAD